MRIALGVVYKPPNFNSSAFITELENALATVAATHDTFILVGDVNIDVLHGGNDSVSFLEMLDSVGLIQIIDSPTRITNTTEKLLDVICTSDLGMIRAKGVARGISDHELVFCEIAPVLPSRYPQYRTLRSFKYFDREEFLNDLYRLPLYSIFDMVSVDDKINYLTNSLVSVIDFHLPSKRYRFTKSPVPWLTDTIRLMQRFRDDAYKKFKLKKSVHAWEYYKSCRNTVNAAIDSERKAFLEYRVRCEKGNPWRALRSVGMGGIAGNSIPGHLQRPDDLNFYYVNSVSSLLPFDDDLYRYYSSNRINSNTFTFQRISNSDIYEIINSIKTSAAGIDTLNINLIKLCCPYITDYITHIINHCLTEGVFPIAWKIALVKPLPKVSRPLVFADLRPISVLPVLSKIAEKVIAGQLQRYIDKNKILPDVQSGFRSGFAI
nr:uncharacterized protein LOC111422115 [Onthophagus taurus]